MCNITFGGAKFPMNTNKTNFNIRSTNVCTAQIFQAETHAAYTIAANTTLTKIIKNKKKIGLKNGKNCESVGFLKVLWKTL